MEFKGRFLVEEKRIIHALYSDFLDYFAFKVVT